MTMPAKNTSAALVLADGAVFWGEGFGQHGDTTGEACFNTSMTGYQEIITDPSYAGQLITFTFPHIGNVGVNIHDLEAHKPYAAGLILKAGISTDSNYRAEQSFHEWVSKQNMTGICNVDTRALTQHLRDYGSQNAVISFPADGEIDIDRLRQQARNIPSMTGRDIARTVSTQETYVWSEPSYDITQNHPRQTPPGFAHVVVIDYGVKRNILRCLIDQGFKLTVVPCGTSTEKILSLKPDGIFLSNGPGDPAATGVYAIPIIQQLLKSGLPIFGICLGHQLLALSLGAQTAKLPFGHRGANHPVLHLASGRVEITSQNHGFHVLAGTLPDTVEITHKSLFDGTNEGFQLKGRPVFSVQYHPEASPGPHDSHYLFAQFAETVRTCLRKTA